MVDVLDFVNRLSQFDTTNITVHVERCVVVRNRNARCRKCSEACASGAIALEAGVGEFALDPEKCVGCGTCATVCPTAALEARNPTDAELLQFSAQIRGETGASPLYACKPLLDIERGKYNQAQVIEVGCLGRIEEAELVTLLARGFPLLQLAHGDCSACARMAGRAVADLVSETMAILLEAWGLENPVELIEGLPASVILNERAAAKTEDVDGLSRRDFLTQVRAQAQGVAVQTAAAVFLGEEKPKDEKPAVVRVMKDGTLPHFIPSRRERMLDDLDTIGVPGAEWLESRLWGRLHIDREKCTSCLMCATFCPTGAIAKFSDALVGEAKKGTFSALREPDGPMGIEYYPADCVQCRLCEDICPVDAIVISPRVLVRELVEGDIIRYEMKPHTHKLNNPMQSYQKMYDVP